METPETQEPGGKETRGGRSPKTMVVTTNLSPADVETLLRVGIKKMKQLGEDVSRDRIISEAIQLYAKGLSSAD
jgi:hypothetical protein